MRAAAAPQESQAWLRLHTLVLPARVDMAELRVLLWSIMSLPKLAALATLIVSLAAASAPATPPELLFPRPEMRDVSSLKLVAGGVQDYEPRTAPGRRLRRVDVEFTSFSWQGEEWRHRGSVLLPESVPDAYRSSGVVVSATRGLDQAGVGDALTERPYAEQAAAEQAALMGIPALLISSGNPGPHYGHAREGELMGFGQRRFMETGDAHWIGYAWLAKVIVRGATALEAVVGSPVDRVVVTGCSKRGGASWIAAAFDDRIVGAFPTCGVGGGARDMLRLKAERWGLDYQPPGGRGTAGQDETIAPAFVSTRVQLQALEHPRSEAMMQLLDPYNLRERLAGKQILYARGTNDPLSHVASDGAFLSQMPEGVRVLLVANVGHTPATSRHLAAWKMWLAHTFAGREVPNVDISAHRDGERVELLARVGSSTAVRAVRLWSADDPRGAYLDARWQASELVRTQDGYAGTIRAPADRYTAYFVEVEDEDPRSVPGVITTPVHEIEPVLAETSRTTN